MNGVNLNTYLESTLTKRRLTLFERGENQHESLINSISSFIAIHTKNDYLHSNASITWERLSSGYRIIDFQIDRLEEALDLLKDYYFCSNNSCAASALYIDYNSINLYKKFILDIVTNENSFCALEEGTGTIIGVAIAGKNVSSDDLEENNDHLKKDLFNMVQFDKNILHEANIYERYKISEYFCIHILCVKPDYYGKGIGTSLIRACLLKAYICGFPVCVGIFPAGPSQTIAQRLNFEVLVEMLWVNMRSSMTSQRLSHVEQNDFENSFVTCMGISLKN